MISKFSQMRPLVSMATDRGTVEKTVSSRFLGGSAVAWWLMLRTPDPEVGGSSPTRVKPCCVLEQGTFTPPKVLVIPRKRWLRPNMTEKLFTGTLRINQPTNVFSNVFDRIHFILAGKDDIHVHKSLNEFEIRRDPTMDYGVGCP